MTRTNAREIVAQLVYEMGFRDDDARTLVREHLDPDYYATLKDGRSTASAHSLRSCCPSFLRR